MLRKYSRSDGKGGWEVRNVQVPVVHLNGTSGEVLRIENQSALDALHAAKKAMVDAAPNERDYYPHGAMAFATARRHHEERMRALDNMIHDLAEILAGIQDQIDDQAKVGAS